MSTSTARWSSGSDAIERWISAFNSCLVAYSSGDSPSAIGWKEGLSSDSSSESSGLLRRRRSTSRLALTAMRMSHARRLPPRNRSMARYAEMKVSCVTSSARPRSLNILADRLRTRLWYLTTIALNAARSPLWLRRTSSESSAHCAAVWKSLAISVGPCQRIGVEPGSAVPPPISQDRAAQTDRPS